MTESNHPMHRMSAPPCQSEVCSGLGPVVRIAALLPALIGDLNRSAATYRVGKCTLRL